MGLLFKVAGYTFITYEEGGMVWAWNVQIKVKIDLVDVLEVGKGLWSSNGCQKSILHLEISLG